MDTSVNPPTEVELLEITQKPLSPNGDQPRLSIPFAIRLPAATAGSFFAGATLGLSLGGTTAGLRFRAENAHRLPKSEKGWYFYHKSKNYHVALGGVREGLKMGTKVGFWAGSFFTIEEAVDRIRGGRKDFLSTVVAGLSVAGGFSAWNRFPLVTAARTARMGFWGGLAFGLAQDAVGLLRGRRIGYVDFLRGRMRRDKEEA